MTKLGPSYKCGWISASIINTLFAILSWASVFLLFRVFVKVGQGSSEGCALKLMPGTLGVAFSLFSVIPYILCLCFYLSFCQKSIQSLITYYLPDVNPIYVHPYVLLFAIFFIVYLPFSLVTKVKTLCWVSRIKFTCILILASITVVLLVRTVKKDGFDPNHQMVTIGSDASTYTSCIASYSTAYLFQPISYPSISNLVNATEKRVNIVLFGTIILIWFLYFVFGLMEYFTLFDLNTGDVFFNYFDNDPIVVIAKCVLSFMMILSIVILSNPSRNVVMLSIVPQRKGKSTTVWIWLSILLFFVVLCLSQAGDMATLIIAMIVDFTAPLNMLTQPAIQYLLACRGDSSFLNVVAFIVGLLGVALTVFLFVQYFI